MENKRNIVKIIEFYLGLIILIIISFFIMHKSIKYSGGFDIIIKNFNLSIILALIPITISLILFFNFKNNIFSRMLLALSSILLIAMLIICIIISYGRFTASQYLFFGIFELIGIGLIVWSCINKNLLMELKKYVEKRRIK